MRAVIDCAGELVSGHAESSVTRESREDQEILSLTPLGLIHSYTDSSKLAKEIADGIELYMRRNGLGMAVANNRLTFVEMEPIGEVAR